MLKQLNHTIKNLKQQLAAAVTAVCISAISLVSSTYAWYAANNSVDATASTISAQANSFVLQIATLEEGAQHGNNQSLVASAVGHKISPASTNDLTNWYICQGWGQNGKVNSYVKLTDLSADGKYTIGEDRYAYIKSEYVLYTVTETGICDVYLDGNPDSSAIQITANGTPTSDTIPNCLRVGITIQDLDENGNFVGDENLVLVYAPVNETGKGNDETAIDGWTYVKDETTLDLVTYPHIYGSTYTWTDNNSVVHDYAATTSDGQNYSAPTLNGSTIASDIDYDGVIMRVYIWLEGTDEQCVNNSNEEDLSIYNVIVSLAGVAK